MKKWRSSGARESLRQLRIQLAELEAHTHHIGCGRKDYSYAVIARFADDPSLNGLSIPAATKRSRGSDTVDEQIEMLLDIEKRGGGSGIFHGMNEADLICRIRAVWEQRAHSCPLCARTKSADFDRCHSSDDLTARRDFSSQRSWSDS